MLVEVNADELRIVLDVACETEDRARDEQRAMLSLAFKLDTQTMKQTVTNKNPVISESTWRVLNSVDRDSEGGDVVLSGDRALRLQQMRDRLRAEEAIAAGKLRPDEA